MSNATEIFELLHPMLDEHQKGTTEAGKARAIYDRVSRDYPIENAGTAVLELRKVLFTIRNNMMGKEMNDDEKITYKVVNKILMDTHDVQVDIQQRRFRP